MKGFQRSLKSRTERQVVVPGAAGDMERIVLISTCHLTQGHRSKSMRQGSAITCVPPNSVSEGALKEAGSPWLLKTKNRLKQRHELGNMGGEASRG